MLQATKLGKLVIFLNYVFEVKLFHHTNSNLVRYK